MVYKLEKCDRLKPAVAIAKEAIKCGCKVHSKRFSHDIKGCSEALFCLKSFLT